eukprot:8973637-Prorocentrum_lima.AAC.1
MPYTRRTEAGRDIAPAEVAQAAAQHLATERWYPSESTGQQTPIYQGASNHSQAQWHSRPFCLRELIDTLKKFKQHKAPGPDEVNMEYYQ